MTCGNVLVNRGRNGFKKSASRPRCLSDFKNRMPFNQLKDSDMYKKRAASSVIKTKIKASSNIIEKNPTKEDTRTKVKMKQQASIVSIETASWQRLGSQGIA